MQIIIFSNLLQFLQFIYLIILPTTTTILPTTKKFHRGGYMMSHK